MLIMLIALSLTACAGAKAEKATKQAQELLENQEYDDALYYLKLALSEGEKM